MNPRPSVHPSPSKTGEAADDASMVARCRRVLQIEAQAVAGLIDQLDAATAQAVRAIYDLTGRLVVTGMGKSGHVARKIAATFASTGTPALFVHPAEAQHGDLGMIQANDLVLAFSYSGETDELRLIAPHINRMGSFRRGVVHCPIKGSGDKQGK